jgi:adenylate cyclase
MFADIAGSTSLYETLGDESAESLISATLKQLSEIVSSYDGDTIKTIGDEIMCCFPSADRAISAAKQMHDYLSENTVPSRASRVYVRIGIHHGPVIESESDIFGDTVNVAARVTSLARAGKTMISGYTYEQLPAFYKSWCRHIMQTMVKGKNLPIDVYDVMMEDDDELTRIAAKSMDDYVGEVLTITYGDISLRLSQNAIIRATLGRGKECDLVIPAPQASRSHCVIECNRGKFTLNDNSTNGTYISHNDIELYFHQEKAPLLGSGLISLGEPTSKNDRFLIRYSLDHLTG